VRIHPEIYPELDRIINKALEKDRDLKRSQRDTSSERVISAAQSPADVVYAPAKSSAIVVAREKSSQKLYIGAAAFLVLLMLGGVAVYFLRGFSSVPTKVVQISHWNKPMHFVTAGA
jgi:hypothetical protein